MSSTLTEAAKLTQGTMQNNYEFDEDEFESPIVEQKDEEEERVTSTRPPARTMPWA